MSVKKFVLVPYNVYNNMVSDSGKKNDKPVDITGVNLNHAKVEVFEQPHTPIGVTAGGVDTAGLSYQELVNTKPTQAPPTTPSVSTPDKIKPRSQHRIKPVIKRLKSDRNTKATVISKTSKVKTWLHF